MRQRFLLLIVCALLPFVALAGGGTLFALREQQERLREEAIHRAETLLGRVERELSTQTELLRLLARSPTLERDPPDLAEFREFAIRFRSELPLWDRVILADAAGRQVVNTGLPAGAALPPVVDKAGHERILATRQPIVGNLVGPGPTRASPVGMISVRVPVQRNGTITHTLAVTVRTDQLDEILLSTVGQGFRGFLVDGAGRIASSTAPDRVGRTAGAGAAQARASGEAGTYDGMTADGQPTVTAYRKSAATGWSAHVALPLRLYQAPIRQSLWILVTAGLFTLALTGCFVWLLRREILAERRDSQLRERSARMEALGRMTGGVAHDINNLLMVVQGNADLLQRRLQTQLHIEDPRLERSLAAIQLVVEKGARLMRDLLVFSRGGSVEQTEVLDPAARIRGNLGLIRQSLRGDIALETDLEDGHLVAVDPVQLDLAILNLAVNARDAMPKGGNLLLSVRGAPHPAAPGRAAVALSVADTGTGIPADALPCIFEPFFTTKEIGKGTGLGLSQVYGFATAAGGTAGVTSLVGRGTTVTILLPEADPVQEPDPPGGRTVPEGRREAGLRVVLVDDNEDVRRITADVLEDAGFAVRQFADAQTALAALEGGTGDVLVSDIRMPGLFDGLGLAREIRERGLRIPVILISGYSDRTAEAQELGFPVIAKPFDRHHLLDAIARETAAPVAG